jgi:hypothetical protein
MTGPSESHPTLRPLEARLREELPALNITVANSFAVRGRTPKGDYETRVFLKNGEIRTTFLRKGGNPLQDLRLLCRTPVARAGEGLEEHVAAMRAHEDKLPWVRKEISPENGDETVTILPFGEAPLAPRVVVRTRADTGRVSMEVCDAREMSPAEAHVVAEALIRAADMAAKS